jgi:hypothetical protein
VAEADPLSGLCGVGVEYQLGRELDTADRPGSQELDSHRQSASWTEGGGDSFDHRNLSTNQTNRCANICPPFYPAWPTGNYNVYPSSPPPFGPRTANNPQPEIVKYGFGLFWLDAYG